MNDALFSTTWTSHIDDIRLPYRDNNVQPHKVGDELLAIAETQDAPLTEAVLVHPSRMDAFVDAFTPPYPDGVRNERHYWLHGHQTDVTFYRTPDTDSIWEDEEVCVLCNGAVDGRETFTLMQEWRDGTKEDNYTRYDDGSVSVSVENAMLYLHADCREAFLDRASEAAP